jgi:hypothetical protein
LTGRSHVTDERQTSWRTVARPPRKLSAMPLATKIDLGRVGFIAVGLPFSILPSDIDQFVTRALRLPTDLLTRRAAQRRAERIRTIVGARLSDSEISGSAREYYRGRSEFEWARVRGIRRRAWTPEIEMEGTDVLTSAIGRRRGVILWRMDFTDSMVLQRACWGKGLDLVQLSDAAHGSGDSQLGIRLVARLVRRAEAPYLAKRIIIPLDRSLGYLRELAAELRDGHVVSILGELPARQNVEVPFFDQRRAFATGAPALAHQTGAALLPVATRRIGPHRYQVVIHPEPELDRSLRRDRFTESAITEFTRLIENAVVESPGDWNGPWTGFQSSSEDALAESASP